jgi:hypothetical protein
MMHRSPRRLLKAWAAAVGMVALLSITANSVGCKQTACIQWSEREGMCPNRKQARSFFGTCTDIAAINDDGAYGGNLCCYDVTKDERDIDECGIDNSTGFGVSAVGVGVGVGTGSFPIPDAGPPPSKCDQSGLCGGTATGCLGCALDGPCLSWLTKCTSEPECTDLLACLSKCSPDAGMSDAGMSDAGMSDTPCEDACSKKFPNGAVLYTAMLGCAVCTQCPKDCASMATSICPAGSGGTDGAGGAKNGGKG